MSVYKKYVTQKSKVSRLEIEMFSLMEVLNGRGICTGITSHPEIPVQLYADFEKTKNFFKKTGMI